MRRWALATFAVGLAVTLTGCGGGNKATGPTSDVGLPIAAEPVEIVDKTRGDQPAFSMPGAILIKTSEDLAAEGLDGIEGLNVDLASHDVIVVSLGEQPTGGYWTDITGAQLVGDTLWVQATVNRPADSDGVTQAITYPFAAASIANTTATRVHLEPREVIGQPTP